MLLEWFSNISINDKIKDIILLEKEMISDITSIYEKFINALIKDDWSFDETLIDIENLQKNINQKIAYLWTSFKTPIIDKIHFFLSDFKFIYDSIKREIKTWWFIKLNNEWSWSDKFKKKSIKKDLNENLVVKSYLDTVYYIILTDKYNQIINTWILNEKYKSYWDWCVNDILDTFNNKSFLNNIDSNLNWKEFNNYIPGSSTITFIALLKELNSNATKFWNWENFKISINSKNILDIDFIEIISENDSLELFDMYNKNAIINDLDVKPKTSNKWTWYWHFLRILNQELLKIWWKLTINSFTNENNTITNKIVVEYKN